MEKKVIDVGLENVSEEEAVKFLISVREKHGIKKVINYWKKAKKRVGKTMGLSQLICTGNDILGVYIITRLLFEERDKYGVEAAGLLLEKLAKILERTEVSNWFYGMTSMFNDKEMYLKNISPIVDNITNKRTKEKITLILEKRASDFEPAKKIGGRLWKRNLSILRSK